MIGADEGEVGDEGEDLQSNEGISNEEDGGSESMGQVAELVSTLVAPDDTTSIGRRLQQQVVTAVSSPAGGSGAPPPAYEWLQGIFMSILNVVLQVQYA